jgi:hypothetical protein
MSAMRAITLQLDLHDYERLEAEAERLGVPPATLARMYVQVRLNGGKAVTEKQRRARLDALDRLTELTADLPVVDAVQIARKSRNELESRSSL